MSQNNISSRLANLWSGFLSLWIKDVEVRHPEVAYENAINKASRDYTQLVGTSSALIRRRDDLTNRQTACREKLAGIEVKLQAALDTAQDDLGMLLIEQKEAATKELANLDAQAKTATADAEKAKDALTALKGNINALKAEKDTKLASLQSSEARIRIINQLDGLSTHAVDQTLATVREHIANVEAQASLTDELHESDVDVRMAKLERAGAQISSKAKLEALKRERVAAAATTKQM